MKTKSMTETELVMQGIEAESRINSPSKTETNLSKKKVFREISALTIPCDSPLKFFHMSFCEITKTDAEYQPQYRLNTESRNAEMPQNIR